MADRVVPRSIIPPGATYEEIGTGNLREFRPLEAKEEPRRPGPELAVATLPADAGVPPDAPRGSPRHRGIPVRCRPGSGCKVCEPAEAS
jgi:hypothetical protein